MPRKYEIIAKTVIIQGLNGESIEILKCDHTINKNHVLTANSETTFYNICINVVFKRRRKICNAAVLIRAVRKLTDTGMGSIMVNEHIVETAVINK